MDSFFYNDPHEKRQKLCRKEVAVGETETG
jgi:hypothetical protein